MVNVAASPLAPVAIDQRITETAMMAQRLYRSQSTPSRGAASIYETRNAVARNPLLVLGVGVVGEELSGDALLNGRQNLPVDVVDEIDQEQKGQRHISARQNFCGPFGIA